ncbi:4-coumarate--CoA ligase [Solidesulfovibrio carbinoliphilus subsp. oakridgensis]|uniref:4-coumarate--CoA ligase n=1 Tax=Solidesulfovibrio carbinoliphilus subsp. oakridgensis TaxID=694327 RepID=G7QBI6_9BACT|nr:AMP-binding protein [Solidesulfovibrio carbinoliphilus]EHJ48849.1 4-coumarate--CoA ligase [Solidesulfovibrio carbinoliphilus subsp. oakridgensis]
MLASLARSLEWTTASSGRESLTSRAAALFGLDQPPADIGDILAPFDSHRLESLASDIQARWTGERLVFRTSGSTGVPRECVQDVAWLVQEAHFLAGLFRDSRRVVALVPAHHIYGFLFSVLLPELLGVPVVDLDPLSLASLSGLLHSGDVVIGFPLSWKKAGEIGVRYPSAITGVTSTGPCPPEVIIQSLDLGLARMAEIHGSTETGGLGYRLRFREPYRLMDHWFIGDGDGVLHRTHPLVGAPVYFAFPDELVWEGERLYRPVGRKDKAVQVAGVNVYPEQVRRVLIEHPLVADAAVRPMRPEEGDRLKAFIVAAAAAPAPPAIIRALREYLINRLGAPEIPRSFTFGPAVPRNAFGKHADWDLSH